MSDLAEQFYNAWVVKPKKIVYMAYRQSMEGEFETITKRDSF